MSLNEMLPSTIKGRLKRGTITKQKVWSFINELNAFSEERLDSDALISGGERISYREMFKAWEQYARVFSALSITESHHARVGLLSGRDKESVYTLYGLNMTGASVSLLHELDIMDHKRWDQLIIKEGITDLILTESKMSRARLSFIWENKDRLGIRNVIVLHDDSDENADLDRLKKVRGALFMGELLEKYKDADILFAKSKSADDAVIFHTSGTTLGIHKPVAISDQGFNEAAARLLRDKRFNSLDHVVSLLSMELNSAYGCCDMLHLPLGYGGAVVLLPEGAGPKKMLRAIRDNKVTILFAVPDYFEMLQDVSPKPDLSSLEWVFLGGSYVSPDAKHRYCDFLKQCGSNGRILVGYGLTEAGGAVTLADEDCFADSIGRPLSGVDIRIFDEEEKQYYKLSDGKRTGVLFISSPSVSSGELNGQTFFELTDIEGERFLNTFDLVESSEDGSLRLIGRMNRFFVNNEGIRFDAGFIEKAIAAEAGVAACGLVPEYNKQLHDTIPVLFIRFSRTIDGKRGMAGKKALLEDILYRVFVKEEGIKETNLPAMAVICRELPVNKAGKVDVQVIARGRTRGKRYAVTPVRRNGQLKDVRVISLSDAGIYTNGGVPEELEYDIELYEQLLEGRDTYMSKDRRMPEFCFFAKMVRGFMEEMEEEERRRAEKRRRMRRNRFKEMDDLYAGFRDRCDDDDYDDDDYDDDDRFRSPRGCMASPDEKAFKNMMRKMGRYFDAADSDEDYEEDTDEDYEDDSEEEEAEAAAE